MYRLRLFTSSELLMLTVLQVQVQEPMAPAAGLLPQFLPRAIQQQPAGMAG